MAHSAHLALIHPAPEQAFESAKLVRLGACMFAVASSFYLTLSTAPAHLSQLGGDVAAGAATTISTFATAFASLIAPRLVRMFGRRRIFATAAALLGLPCLAVFGSSMSVAVLGCAARGVGLGLAFVAAGGLAAALAPAARRGEALGLFGLAFCVPAIFAVPLGLWALAGLGPRGLALFATACGLAPLAGLDVFPGRTERAHSPLLTLPWPKLRWPIAVLAGGGASVGAMITIFASTDAPSGARAAALAMFLHALAAALTRGCSGKLGDRYGHARLAVAGSALSLLAMLLLAIGRSEVAWMASATMLGVAFAGQQNGTLALMLASGSPDDADKIAAVWNIAYDAGLGLGALAYGCICPQLGATPAIFTVAAAGAMATIISALGQPAGRRRTLRSNERIA